MKIDEIRKKVLSSPDMPKPVQQRILQSLVTIDNELKAIADMLINQNLTDTSVENTGGKKTPPKGPKGKGPKFYATSLSADQLGTPLDFTSSEWPEAINPNMIISSDDESSKEFRALQILSLIKVPLEGKVILDCGCGEGYNSHEMANTAVKVIGFDLKEDAHWPGRSKDNLILTIDKAAVAEYAPFDLIVLYDVADHIVGEEPGDLFKWLSNMLSPEGTMFVRTHPWTSRTGGHLYETTNKAFVHLAFTPDELTKAGIKLDNSNQKIVRPMAVYEQWFKEADLVVQDKKIKVSEVEPFFSGEVMNRIIKINWEGKIEPDVARKIMANHFIDYILTKS